MREILEKVKVEPKIIEYIQKTYETYRAKQDLLTMIFDLHKEDSTGAIIVSEPFKAYEREFAIAKMEYDTAMKELQKDYIPEKYATSEYTFEVNFQEECLDIYK